MFYNMVSKEGKRKEEGIYIIIYYAHVYCVRVLYTLLKAEHTILGVTAHET